MVTFLKWVWFWISKFFCIVSQRSAVEKLRKIGCEDQSMLVAYIFDAVSLYDKFRTAYDDFNTKYGERIKNDSIDLVNDQAFRNEFMGLQESYSILTDALHCGLNRAVTKHMGWAKAIFRETRARKNFPEPRCGIKILDSYDGEHFSITSLWGSHGYETIRKYNLEENSVANQVFSNQRKAYLVNNIPQEIVKKSYSNKRINIERAKKYANNILHKVCSFWSTGVDREWVKCWDAEPGVDLNGVIDDNTYKSTMVVPIALNTSVIKSYNTLKGLIEVWENASCFNIEVNKVHGISTHFYCFGYFCVDCHIANYFDEDLDSELGFYIADLLYFYFFVYFLYTSIAPTAGFLEIKDKLEASCSPKEN